MRPLFSLAQLQSIEAAHPHLMSAAGVAAASWISSRFPRSTSILLLAGPGNNGGDAYATALALYQQGYAPQVIDCADAEQERPAPAAAALAAWEDAGGAILDELPEQDPQLVVDGLFGNGLNRAPHGFIGDVIRWLNDSDCAVLALDCPSGLNSFNGIAWQPCVRADWTLSFIGLKPGLLTGRDAEQCGQVFVDTLQLDDELPDADGHTLTVADVRPLLPRRSRASHKGVHGSVGIVGGNSGMVGAALLAGRAALHAGAGRVYVGLLDTQGPAVDLQQPELMLRRAADLFSLEHLSCLAAGPGMGLDTAALQMVEWALRCPLPLLLDADALTLLARFPALLPLVRQRREATLLTPHPAEAARLLQLTTDEVEADRVAAARQLAADYRASVVLKGAGSIIAFPDGEYLINTTGNPGMAAAGQGDVLTGIVAALLAQGLAGGDALLAGTCLHGAAADLLLAEGHGPIGLTASETLLAVRHALNSRA